MNDNVEAEQDGNDGDEDPRNRLGYIGQRSPMKKIHSDYIKTIKKEKLMFNEDNVKTLEIKSYMVLVIQNHHHCYDVNNPGIKTSCKCIRRLSSLTDSQIEWSAFKLYCFATLTRKEQQTQLIEWFKYSEVAAAACGRKKDATSHFILLGTNPRRLICRNLLCKLFCIGKDAW